MAAPQLSSAPVLSTPETHIFEDPSPAIDVSSLPSLSDEQLYITYEIERTVKEIRDGTRRRIALQFPDEMLVDATRVYRALSRGLARADRESRAVENVDTSVAVDVNRLVLDENTEAEEYLSILGDTSYGACCVDEIAAEHVDADVVVHYGRSCLSPPSRLPVIYVFTSRPLHLPAVIQAFKDTYPDRSEKAVLMADIPYNAHIPELEKRLVVEGYESVFAASLIHEPSSPLPNRTVPNGVESAPEKMKEYRLFHIGQPPAALLLTLSSRVASVHIYPTESAAGGDVKPLIAASAQALRRRYALITSLSTAAVFGILINTLSVRNFLHVVEHVKKQITAAGKKSYTFVVGKINAAKIANFSEIEGWVVVGCWESSLVESKEFYRPLITPFELELVLIGDKHRVWTGDWSSDLDSVLKGSDRTDDRPSFGNGDAGQADNKAAAASGETDSEWESAAPEFDLRKGRYVAHTRPMCVAGSTPLSSPSTADGKVAAPGAMVKRANGELVQVGGVVSPGAEYLQAQRTWKGLGSDFEIDYTSTGGRQGAAMEQGRSGVARGYTAAERPERT